MNKCTRFSARAGLIAFGYQMQELGIWEEVEKQVQIKQKVIKHKPLDKLKDAFINIVAGGHGLVEVNTRVRMDEGLQGAFGRQGCAEQSSISTTLNACSTENVQQMRQVMQTIYRQQSQGYRHDYQRDWQVLDVDMSGMPAGIQGEGVTKGYLGDLKGRRGRQLGRVTATRYQEIVVERLYSGKTQLENSLQELVTDAGQVLGMNLEQRQRTVVRVDGGGGRDADINWLLDHDFQVCAKVHNWKRAHKLAKSVEIWHPDPKIPNRECGWVTAPHPYHHPTHQIAIRSTEKNGKVHYRVLVISLPAEVILQSLGQALPDPLNPLQGLFAIAHFYDARGGGVETSLKGSKQGLGITKRNKHNFCAQEMLVLLAQLAYNLILWFRNQLAEHSPFWLSFGIFRLVRDLFQIPGRATFDQHGCLIRLCLQRSHCLADRFRLAFNASSYDLSIYLRQM